VALVRRLSTATLVATLALVAIGGLVRATGSGDACPQWPGCLPGRILPPLEARPLIEFTHRAVVGVLTLLILATAFAAWRRARADRAVLWPIALAVLVVVIQAGIGRVRILADDSMKSVIVTVHFVVAMVLVALVVASVTATRAARAGPGSPDPTDGRFRRLVWWTLGTTIALLAAGAYVRGEGASLVFLDWPLMDGRFVPDLTAANGLAMFVHRVLAAAAVLLGGALAVRARRVRHAGLRRLAWAAFGLLVVQAGIGAAAVLTRLEPWTIAGHVTGGALAWAALVALAMTARRLTPSPGEPVRPRRREAVAAFLQLTKPDIVVLLLITTLPAMILAAGGMPPAGLVAATLLGGTLAAAGANAVNHYLDRDIDEVMARTRRRPIPSRRVSPRAALAFGVLLVAGSFVWLAATVNLVAATLTLGAAGFYVVVYTAWLKRSTPQNIVIGGAAGALPALVGWAAVTGTVGLPAVVLFAIVFMWTPPHFWALAVKHADDYRTAGVPMLPAVRGTHHTAVRIVAYSVAVVSTSFLLVPVAGLGALYLATSVALGVVLVGAAVRLLRTQAVRTAIGLFHFSITYLALLFGAAALDRLLLG
jgi:heme o synthase